MSGTKDYLASIGLLRRKAREVMHRAGVLSWCEYHNAYFDNWADIERAYRFGNALVTRGEVDLDGFSRKDFTDAMLHELSANTTLNGCIHCAHARAA